MLNRLVAVRVMLWPHAAEDAISLPMKTPPNPSFDFAMQMRGTLPEFISSDDFANLNRALEFLFADLRRAAQNFYEAGRRRPLRCFDRSWSHGALHPAV